MQYSKASGGIFIDCGIHDIDIARWLLKIPSHGKQVRCVYATGQNVRHPELSEFGDADNAFGVVTFMNGSILSFHLSRTLTHGHDCFAEIFGTEGKLVVNGVCRLDSHGV